MVVVELFNVHTISVLINFVLWCSSTHHNMLWYYDMLLQLFVLQPKIIILAATSFQAKSIHLQAMKIMEWISAELRFRYVRQSPYNVA